MDLDDLKSFEHLAQTLHFGQSARACGMSASALTRRIQALEAELEHPLFVRDQRQVQLSDAGRLFRTFARRQLEQWQELQNSLRAEDETPTGELNIACTVTACHTILPTLLTRFRQRYPGITLRLVTQDAARSRAQLEAGDLDLAVIPTDPKQAEGLEVKALATTQFAFVAPCDLSLLGEGAQALTATRRAADLSQVPLVAPLGGLERQRLDQWLQRRKVVPRIVAEVRGNEGIIAMVSLGCGIGIVPELVVGSSPLQGSIQRLTGLTPPRGYQVSLCARPRSLKRRVVEAFWNLTGELVPAA
jgi:LysR family positive regulator for ilvC